MGGSVSKLHRLRNRFLINLCKQGLKKNTIRSIFNDVGTEVDGVLVVTKSKLIEIIGSQSLDVLEELCIQCRFHNDCIPMEFIIDFLENGIFFNTAAMETVKKQLNASCIYPEVWIHLGLLRSNAEPSTTLTKYEKVNCNSDKDSAQLLSSENQPLWKKHETVIQERIVKQITVDREGNINELVTTDKSQNDIIHIESKVTGEYAHREYTQQEQTEELDKEMTSFIRATEEYIHLKSKEDEYEYLHSEVPPQAEENVTDEDCESIDNSLVSNEDDTLCGDEEIEYSYYR